MLNDYSFISAPQLKRAPLGRMRPLAVVAVVLMLMSVRVLTAQGTGVVAGMVTDSAGNPVAYARIAIVGTDRNTAAGQDGRYALAGLPTGIYKVRAGFIGYRLTDRDSVRVTAGDTTRLNFQLRRGQNCDLDCSPVVVPARPPKSP